MSITQASPAQTRAIADPTPVEASADPWGSPYLFSSADFERMIEVDLFPGGTRVELWDGRIYQKMAKTQAHTVAGNKVYLAVVRALPPGWFPGGENPIMLGADKIPLPDLIVCRGIPDDYNGRRPVPADIGLIVEVAVTSLKSDLGPRLAAYAEAGVPAYWVVDPGDDVIHVHATPNPAERRYDSVAAIKPGGSIALTLDGVVVAQVAASDILPVR